MAGVDGDRKGREAAADIVEGVLENLVGFGIDPQRHERGLVEHALHLALLQRLGLFGPAALLVVALRPVAPRPGFLEQLRRADLDPEPLPPSVPRARPGHTAPFELEP